MYLYIKTHTQTASEIVTELIFDQFCLWMCISLDPSSGNKPFCTADKDDVCFGQTEKKRKLCYYVYEKIWSMW